MPPLAVATTPIREAVPHTLRSLYISAGTLNLLSKEPRCSRTTLLAKKNVKKITLQCFKHIVQDVTLLRPPPQP
jgi:hypothetical protein